MIRITEGLKLKHRCNYFTDGRCAQCGAPLPEGAQITRAQWVESEPSTDR